MRALKRVSNVFYANQNRYQKSFTRSKKESQPISYSPASRPPLAYHYVRITRHYCARNLGSALMEHCVSIARLDIAKLSDIDEFNSALETLHGRIDEALYAKLKGHRRRLQPRPDALQIASAGRRATASSRSASWRARPTRNCPSKSSSAAWPPSRSAGAAGDVRDDVRQPPDGQQPAGGRQRLRRGPALRLLPPALRCGILPAHQRAARPTTASIDVLEVLTQMFISFSVGLAVLGARLRNHAGRI